MRLLDLKYHQLWTGLLWLLKPIVFTGASYYKAIGEVQLYSKPCSLYPTHGYDHIFSCEGYPDHFCSVQEIYGHHWCVHITVLSLAMESIRCHDGALPQAFCHKNMYGIYECPLKTEYDSAIYYNCQGEERNAKFGIVPFCCPNKLQSKYPPYPGPPPYNPGPPYPAYDMID